MTHDLVVLATPAPTSHRTAEENLGLGYLASTLRVAGYQVSVIDGWLSGLDAAAIAARILQGQRPVMIQYH
jgi:anaerobic magnesium-protoporphyrin IX monomethyl ester cyclase